MHGEMAMSNLLANGYMSLVFFVKVAIVLFISMALSHHSLRLGVIMMDRLISL